MRFRVKVHRYIMGGPEGAFGARPLFWQCGGRRAALAFLMSSRYNFTTFGGSVDVDFLEQISSRTGLGGVLSGRTGGLCPDCSLDVLDPRLASRLRRQSG